MKPILEITKRETNGYCFRRDCDGEIEKVQGTTICDTKLFGITIASRIKWAFVSDFRVFGLLISRHRLQGWESATSKRP